MNFIENSDSEYGIHFTIFFLFFQLMNMLLRNSVYYLILIFLPLLALSCIDENGIIENSQSDIIVADLKKDNFSVFLPKDFLNNYHTQKTFSTNKHDYLFGYNDKTHNIDIFNLTEKNMSSVKLNQEGPNSISGEVNSIFISSLDSIWILANNTVFLINNGGRINEKYHLVVDPDEYIINNSNYSNATVNLHYDSDKRSLFYITIRTGNSIAFFVNILSLNSNKIKKVELKYTKAEKGIGKKYGWMQHPNITYNDDIIIYNFPFNSNIYTVNLNTGIMNSYGGKSAYTQNIASTSGNISMDGWFRHLIENIHFYEVNYDKFRKHYYRLHVEGIDYAPQVPINEQMHMKGLFLSIFDNSFNLINEFQLTDDLYNRNGGWGILRDGFFIIKDNPHMEFNSYDYLEYNILHY